MLSRFIKVLVVTLCFLNLPAFSREYLQTSDINKIMSQIFEQHVDKKGISEDIIKHSFQIYIDQFDPDRIYLLQSEIEPFTQMSSQAASSALSQYKAGQFIDYSKLNDVIQKSILRSRKIRENFESKETDRLFQGNLPTFSGVEGNWTDPDLKKRFPQSEQELENRIKDNMTLFIAKEKKRYGDSYINTRKPQTIKVYEREKRHFEDHYLYVKENGAPMTPAEKDNAFALHVVKSLASSLDAHTSVLDPTEAYDMRVRLENEIEGIGIEVAKGPGGTFFVSDIIKGSPADKSGKVRINDQLIKVDNSSLEGESVDKVMELLRGKRGTKVVLGFKRGSDVGGFPVDNSFDVSLVREEIKLNQDRVKSRSEKFGNGIIGVIKLDSFYQNDDGITSENDVKDAIKKLDAQGNLRGLILDFRENSGGFLSQAVKVAGLFITNGVIVVSKYFNGEEHFYRDVDSSKIFDGPLIILTSKATASAAEIVAQALQDYGIALIVGDEHTYGKGTIQSQTITENDAHTFFKVTVGKYYTVSGKTPQLEGVKADIVVPSPFLHETLGEAYLDSTIKETDTIPASYNDRLEDISPNLKSWYMHYYMPTIQHKNVEWPKFLPQLKRNSQYRMANNPQYQAFIKGSAPQVDNVDEMQLNEAENILKDMIVIHAQEREK